jgi:hypothetical protein
LIGKLISFDDDKIKILLENNKNNENKENNEFVIERKNISKITTYYDFSLSLGGDK